MPELPEVEIVVRQLKKEFVGKILQSIENLTDKFKFNKADVSKIVGKKVINVSRVSKNIAIHFDDVGILINLGMTGKLLVSPLKYNKHLHILIRFEDKNLFFYDIRRFGKFKIIENLNVFIENSESSNGCDIVKYSDCISLAPHKKVKTNIKQFLLSGKWIVGIGNIYACELLFKCKISPFTTVNELTLKQFQNINLECKKLFEIAIKNGGSTISDYVDIYNKSGHMQNQYFVYGRENDTCRVCSSLILRTKQNGRSTYYCAGCQK